MPKNFIEKRLFCLELAIKLLKVEKKLKNIYYLIHRINWEGAGDFDFTNKRRIVR